MKKRYNPIGEITSFSLSSILANMITFYVFHKIFHAPIIYTFGLIGTCSLIFFYVFIKVVCEDRIKLFGTIYPGIVSKEKSKNIVKRLKQIWIILVMGGLFLFFIISWIFYGTLIKAILITSVSILTLFILILSAKFASFVRVKDCENIIAIAREVEEEKK